jgi:hypothetical protein
MKARQTTPNNTGAHRPSDQNTTTPNERKTNVTKYNAKTAFRGE